MTSTPGRGSRPIRIGNCSGFYGDRASAMADMARAGGIDVLTGDYLAEVTMLILGKARANDTTKGYAATFLQHLDAALEHLVANRIKLVVNAGGLNPAGLADTTRELIARRGYDLRVSHIGGDDVFGRLDALQQAGHSMPHLTSGEPLSSWPHQPLTANAYLGGFGIRARWPPAPTSSSPAGSPTPLWSSVPPPGGGVGPQMTTTRSPARSPPDTSSNAGHRRPAATSPVSGPLPTSCSPGSRSPKSPPMVPR